MKRLKIKKLIICLISIIVLALVFNTISTKTFATGVDLNDLLDDDENETDILEDENLLDDDKNVLDDDEDDENLIGNNTNNNNSNNEVYNGTNTNDNSGIPYTGVNDTIIFVIIACGISAVFAYKKIKDYKNI